MATISGFSSSVCSISRINSQNPSQSSKISLGFLQIRNNVSILNSKNPTLAGPVRNNDKKKLQRWQMVPRSVAEETQIPEETAESSTADQPVSVQVSPSDVLTMLFQAEGTLNETAIPAVTGALEAAEGISNLKVQVIEGIASVELTKQTTVQATGVASSLVEIIQSSGFKLQTLNLSFEDEEDAK